MSNPTEAQGTFYIENENLTADIANSIFMMIDKELSGGSLAYTTEVEYYDFEEPDQDPDVILPLMTAPIRGVGRNSYSINLEYFFEWAALNHHRDENGDHHEEIKQKYYPLLYMIAKHDIELVFTYYDYQLGENWLANNTIAVSLDKDALFNDNKIQTNITILEENNNQATYGVLEENGFVDPNSYATKKQLDDGDWNDFFDKKEEYDDWLNDKEDEGWLSDDKSKFVDYDETECTVDPICDHFIPLD